MKIDMFRNCIIGSLLLFSPEIVSQSKNPLLSTAEIVAGRDMVNNKDISGIETNLPEPINQYYIDTISGLVSLQLRNSGEDKKWLSSKGQIMLYDLKNKAIKWVKNFNYASSSIWHINNIILEITGNKTASLNLETGQKLWEFKKKIYYVDAPHQVGLAYDESAPKTLKGIDLKTGSEIWQREISNEYSWNDLKYLNDTTLLLAASGLHTIHILKGTGWDFDAVTGEKDLSVKPGKQAMEIQKEPFTITTHAHIIRELVSNVVIANQLLYFASKENLVCLDYSGKLLWQAALTKELTSKSSLVMKDDNLCLINKGYASKGYTSLDYGKPFIASYNIKDGKQLYFNSLNNKKEQINGHQLNSDTLTLLFSDRIVHYGLSNGALINERSFEADLRENLDFFIGKHVYIQTKDSLYKKLIVKDSTCYYVFTQNGKTLEIDKEFNVKSQIKYKDIYLYYAGAGKYTFLSKGMKTIITDKQGKKVAYLNTSGNFALIGSKLYGIMEQSLIETDLQNVLKNTQ